MTTESEIFSQTMQKTRLWLSDLMEELDWQDRHKAYLACGQFSRRYETGLL